MKVGGKKLLTHPVLVKNDQSNLICNLRICRQERLLRKEMLRRRETRSIRNNNNFEDLREKMTDRRDKYLDRHDC